MPKGTVETILLIICSRSSHSPFMIWCESKDYIFYTEDTRMSAFNTDQNSHDRSDKTNSAKIK